jgi:hypothetical protein
MNLNLGFGLAKNILYNAQHRSIKDDSTTVHARSHERQARAQAVTPLV